MAISPIRSLPILPMLMLALAGGGVPTAREPEPREPEPETPPRREWTRSELPPVIRREDRPAAPVPAVFYNGPIYPDTPRLNARRRREVAAGGWVNAAAVRWGGGS